MDFELSDEQRRSATCCATFVDNEILPVAREWEDTGRYPTEIVDEMGAWGCSGSPCPRSTAASASTWSRSPWSSRRSPAAGWASPASSAATRWPAG